MKRIVIFGINEIIYRDIRNSIDPNCAVIKGFIDNSPERRKNIYMGMPVNSLDKLDINCFDYILITPYSGYHSIKKQLIEYGVLENAIQPFITKAICNYCIGSLDDINIDYDLINEIYFESDSIVSYLNFYQNNYLLYQKAEIKPSDTQYWCNKSNLISHAGGGKVYGKEIIYSNSKEAFDYSLKNNFKLIEFDISYIKKYGMVFVHDCYKFYEAAELGYTIMDLKTLIKILSDHPDLDILFDVKWRTIDDYQKCVNMITDYINTFSNGKYRSLKSQIIFEVYNIQTIEIAKEKGYEVFFTTYRFSDALNFMNLVNICYKYNISCIGFGDWILDYVLKNAYIILSKNIKIFCFSVDSKLLYDKIRSYGNIGIFTNFLIESDIQ